MKTLAGQALSLSVGRGICEIASANDSLMSPFCTFLLSPSACMNFVLNRPIQQLLVSLSSSSTHPPLLPSRLLD